MNLLRPSSLCRWLACALTVCAQAAGAAEAAPPATTGSVCSSPSQQLDEQGFVPLNGIEQWVTIKGERCGNPVVLVVHGGPGNPVSMFSDGLYGPWQKDFTIVHWDQRGSGMTYGRNRPAEGEPLTVAQLRDDGIAVASYVTQHLGARKLILMGGSWGSVLGIQIAKARPDLFHAYITTAQLVNGQANLASSYAATLARAKALSDQENIAKLEALGPPPWCDPRNFGILRRVTRRYEAARTDPAPKAWWQPAALYTTAKAEADYEAGEDYSYLQFVGRKGDGMLASTDLPGLGLKFGLPVFFVQGEEDLVTTPDVARRYFDSIEAPQKDWVLLPRTGHDPNPAMRDAQFSLLKERVLPLIR
ncbi:MAG TPA: alpha/beta fold hydrolase [Ideonella sp.]|uniref:alpha/beta fold hydrolase n=1 Tax=Ideonella sp. TaxID=1929293 RepID=UPI002CC6A482|nr:alpha/beta fold hydrolase [Ideonella sp.]HSI50862.1 alpha/beta fold hydrolase [Ideonella sp.]